MIPRKPYLLRAMVEWAEDNGLTPLIAVDATLPGVQVPAGYVENGGITLNISFSALNQRQIGNELLSGHARFGGRSEYVEVPIEAVSALVVRETGEGMMFPDEDLPEDGAAPEQAGRPHLQAVETEEPPDAGDDDTDPDGSPQPPRGKPKLKIVK